MIITAFCILFIVIVGLCAASIIMLLIEEIRKPSIPFGFTLNILAFLLLILAVLALMIYATWVGLFHSIFT